MPGGCQLDANETSGLTYILRHPLPIQSASSRHPWMPTGCPPDVGGAARQRFVMSTNYRLKSNVILF